MFFKVKTVFSEIFGAIFCHKKGILVMKEKKFFSDYEKAAMEMANNYWLADVSQKQAVREIATYLLRYDVHLKRYLTWNQLVELVKYCYDQSNRLNDSIKLGQG